ncbi:hypothetical protein COCC4DRAFT_33157 [Bipolaris maydis ATCC 48331]|uniref:BTB domain-containing protein n=2 Tax=Cochliobolus heterostrophus TaxID=5016 RepID=M2SMT4_COCH5|nr:uncharacterized protein COCC4DRAFT_33157 [Bipolaris maydis ATCC 48331]EMD86655.1 hypothetical protein COCHEDRAFT_1023863 [Bipolaris maydis C5]KAJ5052610.1 BTB/POZ domain protein [Bipolaris maydis]ENI03051.1 hypothetical protein COCC4DRAFT_33157 [Bipolaris maydis ATCC 48331]KAJ6192281.1 BTB/POZ domain protein [Bipolaris maydis]KAJ6203756.1 BTB/POZ domain protein [Bipolaris maydis]
MQTNQPFGNLLLNLPEYYDSPTLSDGTITCDGKEFRIHKIVLSAQSKFFSNAFEGKWKESVEGTIPLNDDDVSAVEAMLRFLYSFDYDASGSVADVASPMVFNVKVYSIADKYDVPALKSIAREKFKESVKTCWNMDDFPHAIAEVYSSTPPNDQGLRDLIVEVACERITELLQKQGFRDVLGEAVGFASDLVKLQASKKRPNEKQDRTKYRCPNCSKYWEAASSESRYYCLYCGVHYSNWSSYVVE